MPKIEPIFDNSPDFYEQRYERMQRKSRQGIRSIKAFNKKFPVGSKCIIELDSREIREVTVRWAAEPKSPTKGKVGNGRAWFHGVSGAYNIGCVRW